MLSLALQPYFIAVCTDKWIGYRYPYFKGSDFLPFNWSSSYENGVMGTQYFVKQLLCFPFYWASLSDMHSQPFIWPGRYEDQVFERTFPLLKSLAIIIAISLTAFLPWVGDDSFPHSFTVGYVRVSKVLSHCWCDWHFFMQQDCVHMKEIFLVLRIRELPFSFQESIYLLAKKAPGLKLHPLMSSNEHQGWKFIQIPDYVKKQTSMSFWRRECWESMPSSCMFGLVPTAKCVILSEELLSLPSETLPELSSLWEMHLAALCHRKICLWLIGTESLAISTLTEHKALSVAFQAVLL